MKAEQYNHLAAQLDADIAQRADEQAETVAPAADAARGGKNDQDDKPTTAKVLIEIALKNTELFHDERSDGYAVLVHGGVRRTLKLRGREFRRWLAGTFYATTDRAANNEALATAMNVLEAKATFDGRQLALCNRFAMRDEAIYIDMADSEWRVIKVTANGWEIMQKPPVLFRRYSHQMALPVPVRGGKLSDLHRHLAIKDADDKLLVEAWLVACAFEHSPRPAIDLHGPQGASKSTAARILKAITDPSVTESVDLGKAPADLAQVLDHHAVPCFDNVSSIPGWAADLLCRAVTGGAFSKRELYSDDQDILMTFKRAIVITGINIPTHAPDLLDRLLLIELERIASDKRMDEATFWKQFAADRPRLFGALLDGIAGALKHLPSVKLDLLPRMADFARIACAYAESAGVGADKMIDILLRQGARQTQEVLDADPVASAVREFIQRRRTWVGTASELLKLLNESAPTPRPESWPRQSNRLSRRLNVLHSTLNEIGISVRRLKEGQERRIELESRPDSSSASSVSSFPNTGAGFRVDDPKDDKDDQQIPSAISSALEANAGAGFDDMDDQDGKSAVFSSDEVTL